LESDAAAEERQLVQALIPIPIPEAQDQVPQPADAGTPHRD
jgi:hypothetical protein